MNEHARRQEASDHGRLNRESIAYEVARQAQEAGAEVVLTSFGRVKRMTDRRRPSCSSRPTSSNSTSTSRDIEAVAEDLRERWGRLDGILHAIAFAPEDALGGNFLNTPPESAENRVPTSAYSLKALAAGLADLYPEEGASVVGLDFDASVAWPVYDWMGVAKAALEATSRYLARDLGPRGVRVNLVSAGPLGTLAARGIPGFGDLATAWKSQAPLGWDTDDPGPVAGAILFLFSDRHAPSPGRSSTLTAVSTRWEPRWRRWPRRSLHEAARVPDRRDRIPGDGGSGPSAREGDREVITLVRARDDAAARERLDGVLAKLWRDPSPYRDRARAVAGDVTSPGSASPTPSARAWPRTSARSSTARRRSRSTCRSTRRARSTSRARAR